MVSFFDWLFRKTPKNFRRVPKWAKAGKKGKEIFCPKCGGSTTVGHFAWENLACTHCKKPVQKYDWLLADVS